MCLHVSLPLLGAFFPFPSSQIIPTNSVHLRSSPQRRISSPHPWSGERGNKTIILFLVFFFSIMVDCIEYSSLWYTVGPCCLSILYIIVCVCLSQAPNLSLPHPLSTLVTISLFSMSVTLFVLLIGSFVSYLRFHVISDITWYLSFLVWLISLSMIISRSIHVAANGFILFQNHYWLSEPCPYFHSCHHSCISRGVWYMYISVNLTNGKSSLLDCKLHGGKDHALPCQIQNLTYPGIKLALNNIFEEVNEWSIWRLFEKWHVFICPLFEEWNLYHIIIFNVKKPFC